LTWSYYNTEADLPNAATKHGMFAHVHGTGYGYMAHAGVWIKLANYNDIVGAGYTGSAGSTGTQGNAGFTGSIGSTGTQGSIGYTGSAGSTGTQGNVGFTGSVGFTGYSGSLGYTGSAGAGYTGSASTATGYTGSRGIDGVTTTTTIAATIVGTTSTTAGIPGYADNSYTGTLNDGYTLSNGDLYVWKGAGSNAITPPPNVELLVVAGGGSGGIITSTRGAGGGAGGLVYISAFPVSTGTYTVTVGNGGQSASGTAVAKGDNSVFAGNSRTVTALGGGTGGYNDNTNNATTGGSGGGQWYPGYTGAAATQPSTTNDGISTYAGTGFGNKGGDSSSSPPYGSGGGGAGAAGGNWNGASGPVGGIGKAYDISGTSTYYAGGGGADNYPPTYPPQNFVGGLGGGGTGYNNAYNVLSNATTSTGGGGGAGGSGGSGVVILRYADTYPVASATTGTVTATTTGGYRIYKWTGSGSITIPAASAGTPGLGWVLVGNFKGTSGYTGSAGTQGPAGGYTGSAGSTGYAGSRGADGAGGETFNPFLLMGG
jgi:hypothetical protein